MGGELILFSFAVGLVPIFFGLWIMATGQVYLTASSKEPIRGTTARLLGVATLVAGCVYDAIVLWAWSIYDR